MHGATVDLQLLKCLVYLLYLHLTSREDDDSLQVTGLEDILNDLQFLGLIADISTLLNLLSRLAHSKFNLYGVLQKVLCELLNVFRHGSREHDGLTVLGKSGGNLHDILRESHVEHTVSLIEHKETHLGKVDITHGDM